MSSISYSVRSIAIFYLMVLILFSSNILS